ncbi:hypothetical protein B0J18DRAFT_435266 [Chaetomium sp. MPI-SDFR-AT-0129]|nr:hypothetical protein B0J18DRAFT_435266 [Chaetomium sp. MPI-SDFR-AT-0129]
MLTPTVARRCAVPPAATRLSKIWFPSGGIAASEVEDSHARLIRAGFLRQSNAGMFHLLPLGHRVLQKIERIVARHMEESLGASQVSLSSVSARSLWERSGRFNTVESELFRFSDRKGVPYLLAPTHEEEITSLVAGSVRSHKELPLRLYQITRKYRDEFRPRHGLLRGREFVMKDLYTFDSTAEAAIKTYDKVRAAYDQIFADMKLPVLSAKAHSGDMGGDLSHEYHLPTSIGEDRVINCNTCNYIANEEVVDKAVSEEPELDVPVGVWRGITKDRRRLVNVWYPKRKGRVDGGETREYTDRDIDLSVVKSVVPDIDTAVEDALPFWSGALAGQTRNTIEVVHIIDGHLSFSVAGGLESSLTIPPAWPSALTPPDMPLEASYHRAARPGTEKLSLLRTRTGDKCPKCPSGTLTVEKAMELGHAFYLGTRYSQPLGAMATAPASGLSTPMQMGCYGIGISRIMGAAAAHFADDVGFNWPLSIAPFSSVIVPGNGIDDGDAMLVHGVLNNLAENRRQVLDIAVDDRQKSLPWKLKDADLIGYPIIVLLGREWKHKSEVEVQCRRLGIKQTVSLDRLNATVSGICQLL